MDRAWAEFLKAPDEPGHAVQVYAEPDELAESVAAYLAAGFAAGDPAVVVARAEHFELFRRCSPQRAGTRRCSSGPAS